MSERVRGAKRSRAITAAADQPLDPDVRKATIPVLGFVWRDFRDSLGKFKRLLVWQDSRRIAEARSVPYSSLPNLFRMFAQVKATEDGFVGFANQYGRLGVAGRVRDGAPFVAYGERYVVGEEFKDWAREHSRLKQVDGWLKDPTIRQDSSRPTPIELTVNDALETYASCGLVWNERRNRYTLKAYPVNLLGLMWWQVARVMTGEVVYTYCEQCANPIETGPDGHHIASKRFCSAACNQKHHRSRVKEAKALKASGLPVSKIAQQLNTTPDAIKHWLTKVK